MNKRKAQTTLDKLVSRFGDEMSRINFDIFFAASSFERARANWKSQIEYVKKYSAEHKGRSTKRLYNSIWCQFSADDARTYPPKYVALNAHGAQDEELILALEESISLQLNWFFVAAYEAYERFVKSTYGALGYLDRGFWACSDYGGIAVIEIPQLPQKWFAEQMRRLPNRFSTSSIMKRLRMRLPHFNEYENSPLDLRMWVKVAEHFRHIIVHDHGNTPIDGFWERMDVVTGFALDGNTLEMAERKYWISKYIEPHGESYKISMMDRSNIGKKGHRIEQHVRRMHERLASHALLIYSCLAEHFQFTPHWERG